MKLKFRMEACLFAKSLGKLKKKNHQKKKKRHKSKKNSIASINIDKLVQNMSKGKRCDFQVINLNLKPHLVSPFRQTVEAIVPLP